MNPRDNVWNFLYRKTTKITSQAKDTTRCHITIGCTSCRKREKIRRQKAGLDKEWNLLVTIPAWHLEKVNERGVALEAQKDKKKVHFATLMDMCRLKKNAELEPKFQVVVLRGDIDKDDLGAHAVFTEQGSSASQMDRFHSIQNARPPDGNTWSNDLKT